MKHYIQSMLRNHSGRPAMPWRALILVTLFFGVLLMKLSPVAALIGALVLAVTVLVWSERRYWKLRRISAHSQLWHY